MRFDQLGAHLQQQANRLDDKFLTEDIAPMLLAYFEKRFDDQKTPEEQVWKSDAQNTKFAGRFSASYVTRPSGNPVTAGSKRWNDTGTIKGSLVAIKSSWSLVIKSTSELFKYMNNAVFGNNKKLIFEITKKIKAKLVSIARP